MAHLHRFSAQLRILNRCFRILLITAIIWLGWATIESFKSLWSGPRQVDAKAIVETQPDVPSPIDIVRSMPVAGHWSVPNLNWTLGKAEVESDQVDDVFADIIHVTDQLPNHNAGAERGFLDVLEKLKIQKEEINQRMVYRSDQSQLRLRVVVSKADRLLAGAVAIALEDHRWLILEMRPNPANKDESSVTDQHILPLPRGSRRIIGRWSRDGELLLEIVQLETSLPELVKLWMQAGWFTQPSPIAGGFNFLCKRNDVFATAWSPDNSSAISVLMVAKLIES